MLNTQGVQGLAVMEDHDLEQMQTVLQRVHTVAEVNILLIHIFHFATTGPICLIVIYCLCSLVNVQ